MKYTRIHSREKHITCSLKNFRQVNIYIFLIALINNQTLDTTTTTKRKAVALSFSTDLQRPLVFVNVMLGRWWDGLGINNSGDKAYVLGFCGSWFESHQGGTLAHHVQVASFLHFPFFEILFAVDKICKALKHHYQHQPGRRMFDESFQVSDSQSKDEYSKVLPMVVFSYCFFSIHWKLVFCGIFEKKIYRIYCSELMQVDDYIKC